MGKKILVACEESQAVTIAFRELGFEAYSCDLLDCSGGHPEWHIKGDAIAEAYSGKYDMMIAFPPCTYISYVGTQHWNKPGRLEKRLDALQFFAKLWLAPIEMICLENPRGCASPTIAKYSQEIHPYFFGNEFSKPTWLWLKNLPQLKHVKTDTLFENSTHVDKGEFITFVTKKGKEKKHSKWYHDAISLHPDERSRFRSKTFPGIAQAMASQWSPLL